MKPVPLAVKICGVNSPQAARATAGADYVGFVFYPPSPRFVSGQTAAALKTLLSPQTRAVGLFVDADDALIARTLDEVSLDFLQFHGRESPERVRQARAKFSLPVIKAVSVAEAADLERAADFAAYANMLLFDAKPAGKNALPGGNALSFDWTLLQGKNFPLPWMLSGGLDENNLRQAVSLSGASAVDVSSGVESARGIKDPEKISRFLALAAKL